MDSSSKSPEEKAYQKRCHCSKIDDDDKTATMDSSQTSPEELIPSKIDDNNDKTATTMESSSKSPEEEIPCLCNCSKIDDDNESSSKSPEEEIPSCPCHCSKTDNNDDDDDKTATVESSPKSPEEILKSCQKLCKKGENIIYLVECGSRSWGYDSQACDYDVRGIYVHPQPYTHSVIQNQKRNMIIEGRVDGLDIVLWDVIKVFQSYYMKSNQMIISWLTSDIVYYHTGQSMYMTHFFLTLNEEHLKSMVASYYDMFNDALKKFKRRSLIKDYICIWRAILCAEYAIQFKRNPPQNIRVLLESFEESHRLKERLEKAMVLRKNFYTSHPDITLTDIVIPEETSQLRQFLKEQNYNYGNRNANKNENEFNYKWKAAFDFVSMPNFE